MTREESIKEVATELGLYAIEDHSSVNRQLLINKINELLIADFQKLVSILYRMDVSEKKLRSLLEENAGHDAGPIIADLMIERQAQKIKSRQEFRQPDNEIDENEKW